MLARISVLPVKGMMVMWLRIGNGYAWLASRDLTACSMCWCLRNFLSSMSLLCAQGRNWSGFRRGWLKDLKIEKTPGYEEMEVGNVAM